MNNPNESQEQKNELLEDVAELAVDALVPSPDVVDVLGDVLGALFSCIGDS